MLQNIREGIQGPWAIGIVALIVVSFVFTGVGSYISSSNSGAVAIVNGEEIQATTLDNAYQNERARLQSQFGDAVNSLFASESYINQFRGDILDRLINDALVSQKASELGLRVGDEQIKKAIAVMPEFQVAGAFDNDIYNSSLARAGYTPTEFAEYIRVQLTRQQLEQSLRGTGFGLEHQVQRVLALQEQTRNANSIEIDIAKYQDTIELSEDEIVDYYNSNLSDFDTQEQVKLAYVSLSIDDLKAKYDASEEEIAQAYEDNIAAYTTEEARRISHILFELGDNSEEATAKAQEVLTKLAAGEDFADLAATYSDDIISAEDGGDLNTINRGDYSGPFEDAAFSLAAAGDVSDVVETEFGLHIIKLTELTPAKTTPLDEVADTLKDDVITNKATDEYFSLQNEMSRLAFEEPDSLEPVAQAIGRPIIESTFFEAGQLPPGINYPQLADLAFSSELIDEQVNSELIELSDSLLMIVRVAEHKPQRTRSLDEVKAQIESALKSEKAQEQALVYAQEIQTALFAGEDDSALLAEHDLSWTNHTNVRRDGNDMPRELISSLFTLSEEQNNNSSVIALSNGNVGIVTLSAVNSVSALDEALLTSTASRVANSQTQQSYQNFIDALRANADVHIVTQ